MQKNIPKDYKEVILIHEDGERILTVKNYSNWLLVVTPEKGGVIYKATEETRNGQEIWAVSDK